MGPPGRGRAPGSILAPRAVSHSADPRLFGPPLRRGLLVAPPGVLSMPSAAGTRAAGPPPRPSPWHLLRWHLLLRSGQKWPRKSEQAAPRGRGLGTLRRDGCLNLGVPSETPGGLARARAGLEPEPALSASPVATCHFVGWCKV